MNNHKLLDPLIDLLKIQSISTQDKYKSEMKRTRKYLTDLFTSIGFETKILKGIKHDAIFASLSNNPNLPTILIYGHYDVQPPDPIAEWKTLPFKPIINNGNIYGRGTTDNKGQLLIHMMAIKKLLAKNQKITANFKFLIEGEEEIGSISIPEIINKNKKLLSCNYLIASDSNMPKLGQSSIDISLRGLLYTEIEIQTAEHDLHSGQFGGVAENPIIILSRIINNLKDKNGKILIPGFYKNILKTTTKELIYYKSSGMTKEKVKTDAKLYLIGGGEKNFSIVERMWIRPTLDVNGIWGGYMEEGSKTIIPAKASAKISMRLVANQDPDDIFVKFEKYVKGLTPKRVKITVTHHADCLPYKAPIENPIFDLMKKSLKKVFGKEPVFTGVGGSIGFVPIVTKALNVPCILVGFGLPTDNLHAPNEHFNLENYYKGIEAMTDFYSHIDKVN